MVSLALARLHHCFSDAEVASLSFFSALGVTIRLHAELQTCANYFRPMSSLPQLRIRTLSLVRSPQSCPSSFFLATVFRAVQKITFNMASFILPFNARKAHTELRGSFAGKLSCILQLYITLTVRARSAEIL